MLPIRNRIVDINFENRVEKKMKEFESEMETKELKKLGFPWIVESRKKATTQVRLEIVTANIALSIYKKETQNYLVALLPRSSTGYFKDKNNPHSVGILYIKNGVVDSFNSDLKNLSNEILEAVGELIQSYMKENKSVHL